MELIWRIQILLLLSEPKGFTCDLCVNLLTEIENILEDQTIDDAVITFFSLRQLKSTEKSCYIFTVFKTCHNIESFMKAFLKFVCAQS